MSCYGGRPTGRKGTRSASLGGRVTKVAPDLSTVVVWCFSRSALVPKTVGRICVPTVQLLTCSPARVATTVTRDSRNTCRRWNAAGGGCACDMASALSDVSAPLWEVDQWFSQRGVVDGWATRGRVKLGRAHIQARDVARVCVWCFDVALRAITSKGDQFILPSQSRRKMEENFSEKSAGIEICSTQLVSDCHAGGNTSFVKTLLHTCWSPDEVLAEHSMHESRCSDLFETWANVVANGVTSWSAAFSSTWTTAQHVCKIRGSNLRQYLSSHVCCTP